jgi:uncharacterized protein with PIN domain
MLPRVGRHDEGNIMRCKACNAMISCAAADDPDPLCGQCLREALKAANEPNEEYRPGRKWAGVKRVLPDSYDPEVGYGQD